MNAASRAQVTFQMFTADIFTARNIETINHSDGRKLLNNS